MVRRCGVGDDRGGDVCDDDGNGMTTIDTRAHISVSGGGEIKLPFYLVHSMPSNDLKLYLSHTLILNITPHAHDLETVGAGNTVAAREGSVCTWPGAWREAEVAVALRRGLGDAVVNGRVSRRMDSWMGSGVRMREGR